MPESNLRYREVLNPTTTREMYLKMGLTTTQIAKHNYLLNRVEVV